MLLAAFNFHLEFFHSFLQNCVHCVYVRSGVGCVLREHSVSVAIFADQTQPVFSSFKDEMQIFELRKWK